jgi:hypothetical protein
MRAIAPRVCRCSRGLLIRVDGSIKPDQTIRGYVLWNMYTGVVVDYIVLRVQGWNHRFFVLSNGKLTYFKTEKVRIRSSIREWGPLYLWYLSEIGAVWFTLYAVQFSKTDF